MSEGSQGKKRNQRTNNTHKRTERKTGVTEALIARQLLHRDSSSISGDNIGSSCIDTSSTSTISTEDLKKPYTGARGEAASEVPGVRAAHLISSPSYIPDVRLYVRHLVESLSDRNYTFILDELDKLCSTTPLTYPPPKNTKEPVLELWCTLRCYILQLLLTSKTQISTGNQDFWSRALVHQVSNSNFTDLFLIVGSLVNQKPVRKYSKKAQQGTFSFQELLHNFFSDDATKSTCGIKIALSVGLCLPNTNKPLSKQWTSLLHSSLEYIEENLKKKDHSSEDWYSTAAEVLLSHNREVSDELIMFTSRSTVNNKSGSNSMSISNAAQNISRGLSSPDGIIRFLSDLGPGCTSSVSVFRETLREAGGDIDEVSIARLLCFFADVCSSGSNLLDSSKNRKADEEISNILVGTLLHPPNSNVSTSEEANQTETNSDKTGDSLLASDSNRNSGGNYVNSSGWDLEVIRTCISEDFNSPKRPTDWDAVARSFDWEGFELQSSQKFQIWLDLYQAGAKRPPPSKILLSEWKNASGQLSLLERLAFSSIFSFDLTDAEKSDYITPTYAGGPGGPSECCWVSGDYLQRLLTLSDYPDLNKRVRDVFFEGLLKYPEVFLCSIVRLQLRLANANAAGGDGTSAENNCTAGMQMKNELTRELIPHFFQPNQNPQLQIGRDVISAVISHLWSISRNMVTLACIESWRTCSKTGESPSIQLQKRVHQALHTVGILRLLGPESITPILNNNKDVEFGIATAMILADQEVIQMAPWLNERINSQGIRFVIQLIAFLSNNYSSAVPRAQNAENIQSEDESKSGTLVTLDNLAACLKVLQAMGANLLDQAIPNMNQVPAGPPTTNFTVGDSVKALTDACLDKHPSLRTDFGTNSSEGVTGSTNTDDIEEMANSYFQKIYTSPEGVEEVVAMLKKFKTSGSARENDIFACMIHNLFDEYRFFSKYPEKELRITGKLFGLLIREQLVSSITLGIALRYVLEALRKPPGDETNSNSGKMFRFGMFAFDQFKNRLHEWPQYCSHIMQIPHLQENYKELLAEIDGAMDESQQANNRAPASTAEAGKSVPGDSNAPLVPPGNITPVVSAPNSPLPNNRAVNKFGELNSMAAHPSQPIGFGSSNAVKSQQPPLLPKPHSFSEDEQTPLQILPNGLFDQQSSLNPPSTNNALSLNGALTPPPLNLPLHQVAQYQPSGQPIPKVAVFGPGLGRAVNNTADEPHHSPPPDAILDRVQFIINNVSPSNVDSKATELREILPQEHFGWLGHYLVVKRISTQPNFHHLYLTFLDCLGDFGKGLVDAILASVYVNVGKLLRSTKITTSTSERSLLKNLGSWLGQITLARNKPILQLMLDCKELLFQGYETGMLIAVTPFVAKILEGSKNSIVFQPQNPWLMGLLSVFRALYEVEDLKMNIKFEVEVLCKNLGVKLEDIPLKTDDLNKRISPVKERNPDFNMKSSIMNPSGSATPTPTEPSTNPSPDRKQSTPNLPAPSAVPFQSLIPQFGDQNHVAGVPKAAASFSNDQQQTVIPNLAAYVTVNPSLAQVFRQIPQESGSTGGISSISFSALKRTVPVAVDRAIREIIQPVVERSVTIACITTKEIVTKDYAMESDENKMRKAAQLMVKSLAGSLALVTCREPLRASVSTHLRQLLLASAVGEKNASSAQVSDQEQAAIEQCVTVCATENLELGCMLIEKAATEKAVRDMDEALAPALQSRRKHREETGQPFYDMSIFGTGNHRYPNALPEPLRPKPGGGLRPDQLLVYEAFQRMSRQPAVPGAPQQSAGNGLPSSAAPVPAQGGSRGVTPTNISDAPNSAPPAGSSILPSPTPTGSNGAMQQQLGLEALSSLATKLNSSVTALLAAAGPRAAEITLAMLPPDQEIRQLLMAVKQTASSSQASRPLNTAETEAVLGFAQSVFKRLYELSLSEPLRLEALVALLEGLNECCPQLGQDMGTWSTYAPTDTDAQRKLHLTILLLLVRSRLIPASEVDESLARNIDGGRNSVWLDFTLLFVRTSVLEGIAKASDMPKVMEVLKIVAEGQVQVNSVYLKPINRLLDEVRTPIGANVSGLAVERQSSGSSSDAGHGILASDPNKLLPTHQQSSSIGASLSNLAEATTRAAEATVLTARKDPPGMRQQVTFLLDNWMRIHSEAPGSEKALAQYLQLLQQHGVGKVEDQTERFFRHSTELVVDAVLQTSQPVAANDSSNKQQAPSSQGTVLNYNVVDAYAKLVALLIRYMNGGGTQEQVAGQRISLLNKVLGITMRTLMTSYERAKQNVSVGFHWDQRPWFRLLLNMVHDLNSPSPALDPISLGVLSVFGSAFHVVQPLVVPGFAFAWLELISHRMFLSKILLAKGQKGWGMAHQLLIDLFLFLEPHLRKTELTDAIKQLYKGTLRVLLVLLHDFPSLLAGYHLSFCNVIPENCVQLRNLILSALPPGMKTHDPLSPNLKIDLLPEISQSPVILSNVTGPLGSIRSDLDSYLKSRHPANFVTDLLPRLYKENSNEVDAPRVNSLVLYVGIQAIARLQNSQIAHTPEMELLQKLMDFDDRGRYITLNAIANQLRYPSSHTHYYSCVMLFLFSEAKDEGIKEQITRVLLERVIVHRPHPWGLLITFIELIRNQRYQFWNHPFTHCSTEIEKVFESVARSVTAGGDEPSQ